MEANVTPHEAMPVAPDAAHLRIVIVSGVRFLREGLAEVFERDPRVSVVELCADLFEAAALAPALDADVVLLDATVPGSIAAVRRALEIVPGMRIIVTAVRETEDDIVAWAEAGVIGYIPSTAALTELVRLVLDIHGGRQICSSQVAAGLLRRIALERGSGKRPRRPGAGAFADQARAAGRPTDHHRAERQGDRPPAEHQPGDDQVACAQFAGQAERAAAQPGGRPHARSGAGLATESRPRGLRRRRSPGLDMSRLKTRQNRTLRSRPSSEWRCFGMAPARPE